MQRKQEKTQMMLEGGNPRREINREREKITNPPEVESQRKLSQQEETQKNLVAKIAIGWILELSGH